MEIIKVNNTITCMLIKNNSIKKDYTTIFKEFNNKRFYYCLI